MIQILNKNGVFPKSFKKERIAFLKNDGAIIA